MILLKDKKIRLNISHILIEVTLENINHQIIPQSSYHDES